MRQRSTVDPAVQFGDGQFRIVEKLLRRQVFPPVVTSMSDAWERLSGGVDETARTRCEQRTGVGACVSVAGSVELFLGHRRFGPNIDGMPLGDRQKFDLPHDRFGLKPRDVHVDEVFVTAANSGIAARGTGTCLMLVPRANLSGEMVADADEFLDRLRYGKGPVHETNCAVHSPPWSSGAAGN